MHPSKHAQEHPDKAAIIMASTGETVTYGQLEERSNQFAQLFRSRGSADWRHARDLPGKSSAIFLCSLGRPAIGAGDGRDIEPSDRRRGELHIIRF